MQLVPLAQACRAGACPTVFATEGSDVVVQGYVLSAPSTTTAVPEGEALVRIPGDLIVEAARLLTQG
jgi:hypothetical protein